MAIDGNAIKKALLDSSDNVFDSLLEAEIEQGKSRHEGMGRVLLKAVEARYGANGRAMQHMRHFLLGRGTPMEIRLTELLNEDKGASARISGEILRRANGIMTAREAQAINDAQRMSLPHNIRRSERAQNASVAVNIDPVITLFQKTFAIEDWSGALGTFPITWELIACPSRKTTPLTVLLRGANEYRWHPSDDRLTRRLHQYAQELIDVGQAKPFMMTTGFLTVLVGQLNEGFLRAGFNKQTNPSNNSFGEFFTAEQGALIGQAAIHSTRRSISRFMAQFD